MSLLKWRYWTSCPKACFAPAMKLLKKTKESGNNLKILTIMKKILLAAAAALTALVACQKNEVAASAADSALYATIEETDATKTYMDSNNNIRWSEGDQVIAFMKTSLGLRYQIKDEYIGKTSGYFSQVSSGSSSDLGAGIEWDHNVVYYPYSSTIEAAKSGSNYVLDVVLPSEQTYAAESFGNGAMAMVAVSENNNITFRNVLGGMKLQLKGTQIVKFIKIEGKNNEKLSGAATVTAYMDETKPAITMSQTASTSVTLNCGSGVQLSESTASEFIISLPPVLFSKGFTVTVTDTESNTYTVGTDKTNIVIRSSLLVMPPVKLGASAGEDSADDDELIIPVSYVNLNSTSLKLYEGDIAQLTATVGPKDATDKTVVWSSDNRAVASVDQTGQVTALQSGSAMISAVAGGKIATCSVTVSEAVVAVVDYIDEYGINHGKGTVIGMAVWAPVNCGYHKDDYKYGKLYQWGRKYGQGYDENDATVPIFAEGRVSEIGGNHKSNANVFYTGSSDWVDPRNDKLWNSGTESSPVKTDYDPCPDGWRVPTYTELNELCRNYSAWTSDDGRNGCWFSGASIYTEKVPQVFFSAAGWRSYYDCIADDRGDSGYYWSSGTHHYGYRYDAVYLFINSSLVTMYTSASGGRADGYSVRCVQE